MNEVKAICEVAGVVLFLLNEITDAFPGMESETRARMDTQKEKLSRTVQELMGDEKNSLSHSD